MSQNNTESGVINFLTLELESQKNEDSASVVEIYDSAARSAFGLAIILPFELLISKTFSALPTHTLHICAKFN